MTPPPGPIAYLTGEYPRATDTLIQCQVAALQAQLIASAIGQALA